tara:strand:+ start:7552 stop:9753 length:2202 start_codon:yes stop_codon:yes gene_type:complete
MNCSKIRVFIVASLFLAVTVGCQNTTGVNLMAQVESSIEKASPGDTIVIPSGIYQDFELNILVSGTENSPIVIRSEENGSAIFSGNSKLYIGGTHLIVKGLWFSKGWSDNSPIISFRSKNGNVISTHSRVTECAISDYTNPDRIHSDHWIEMFGRENRFDHNYVGTKLNLGATMVVRLGDSLSLDNKNSIDSNYFAPKPRLGSNGGETLRIGSSANSLKTGNALVTANYFDQCGGEVEVLSIKSSDNTVSNNVFYECQGVLALRHGNRNKVHDNYFIGNNKPATGGLRVINAGHQVYNNFFYGLTGTRFFAALAVMNGVPNSAINRYHQVADVDIYNNSFIHCNQVAFGIGSDKERTATPVSSTFKYNTLTFKNKSDGMEFVDDVSGIDFTENVVRFDDSPEVGSVVSHALAQKVLSGPTWLKKLSVLTEKKLSEKSFEFTPSTLEYLQDSLDVCTGGDTLWIPKEGLEISKPIKVYSDLVIASKGTDYAVIQPGKNLKGTGIIEIQNGVSLCLSRIWLKGRNGNFNATYGIQAKAPMLEHYNLLVENCRFSDFKESRFAAIHAEKGTFADTIIVNDSWFKDFSGHGIALNSENDDRGRYNAEYIFINDCVFADLMGSAIDVYRGGNDESTLGPFVEISGCQFLNVCNRELGTTVRMIGVQVAKITDCDFIDSGQSGRAIWFEDPAWANIDIGNINLAQSGIIQTFYSSSVNRNTITTHGMSINRERLATWEQ